MGVRHRHLPLEGVQFHPESILTEHGARIVANFLGASAMSSDAAAHFREVAATHRRCFWLDGGGAREWSGKRSMIGRLADDDVSLTYDAARGEVTRHAGGQAVVVGSDPFAALEAELAEGPEDELVGRLLRVRRPARPAGPARRTAARRGVDARR